MSTPLAGHKGEAQKLIRSVEEGAQHRYFCPYEIGAAYVCLGDPDTAVKWFRQGVKDRADCMAWLGVEPWIEPFRSDPRYAQLLREVGLAPRHGIGRRVTGSLRCLFVGAPMIVGAWRE